MRLRAISRVLVVILTVVVGLIIFAHNHLVESQSASVLKGTDLQGVVAPQFALTDQAGTSVSLQQLQGHPVVLTFLYTHCPDECPLTMEKLRTAASALGAQAADVRWIAVSTDPAGDTPASATAFVAAHHLDGRFHYLLGTQPQLQRVWQSYGIEVKPETDAVASVSSVTHTLGVYVIDAQGRERVFLDGAFDPNTLSEDLRSLLGGK